MEKCAFEDCHPNCDDCWYKQVAEGDSPLCAACGYGEDRCFDCSVGFYKYPDSQTCNNYCPTGYTPNDETLTCDGDGTGYCLLYTIQNQTNLVNATPVYRSGHYFDGTAYHDVTAQTDLHHSFSISSFFKMESAGTLFSANYYINSSSRLVFSVSEGVISLEYPSLATNPSEVAVILPYNTWKKIDMVVSHTEQEDELIKFRTNIVLYLNDVEVGAFNNLEGTVLDLTRPSCKSIGATCSVDDPIAYSNYYTGFIYYFCLSNIADKVDITFPEPCVSETCEDCEEGQECVVDCKSNEYITPEGCQPCLEECDSCVDDKNCRTCLDERCSECPEWDTCVTCKENTNDDCTCLENYFYLEREDSCEKCYDTCAV